MKILYWISLFVFLCSCRADLLDCVNSAGPIRTEKRNLPAFTHLFVSTDIDVEWRKTEGEPKIEITCGRNLIKKVKAEFIGKDSLKVSNTNTCNWVRSFDSPMKAVLYSKSPQFIKLEGYGEFVCKDTLTRAPLSIQHYGAGKTTLLAKLDVLYIDFTSPNDLILIGKVREGHYYIQRYGKLRAENMEVNYLNFNMLGENDAHFNVTESISGFHNSQRNIYLIGNPKLNIKFNSSGLLIRE